MCVLVYCTWLSIYVGVGTICVHNTMSIRYVSGVFVHTCVSSLSSPPLPPSAAALLSRALVRLELDELLRHVVVVALREDAQHRQARLVHVDAPAQRHPAGDAALAGYVLHLHHGHAHGAVLSGKAVVLHTHLKLVALRTALGAQGAETGTESDPRFTSHLCSTLSRFLIIFKDIFKTLPAHSSQPIYKITCDTVVWTRRMKRIT